MKIRTLFQASLLAFLPLAAIAQAPPKLYITIVSHNEPSDGFNANPGFTRARTHALTMAEIVRLGGAKWNMQTSQAMVSGSLNLEAAGTSSTDIFEVLSSPPYDAHIEIDPRMKTIGQHNIADLAYLLDSCGANPSHNVGGFLMSTTDPGSFPLDWWQFQQTIQGAVYPIRWTADLIWGPGSYEAHTNDFNDFGMWKPASETNFGVHNDNNRLWCMGNGCTPLLDSLDDPQAIFSLIQGHIDSIQAGHYPLDGFYGMGIMTNMREYGPMFFSKITALIDSINTLDTAALQWVTITERRLAFEAWQNGDSTKHVLWHCGQVGSASIADNGGFGITLSPNPGRGALLVEVETPGHYALRMVSTDGRTVMETSLSGQRLRIDTGRLKPGMYMVGLQDDAGRVAWRRVVVE